MANHEDYLDALTAFARDGCKEIPPVLEQYLNGVAKNGETLFQWPLLKPLIVGKMEQVIEDLQHSLSSENITSRPNVENVRFDIMRTRIMDAVHKFTGAPFTIQRLCELLIDPRRHYKRSDKFMRGLEKNVLVVSTVDPFGRKVVSEAGNKHLVNGMDNGIPIFSRDSSISSSLPPVPGWVTTSTTTIPRTQDSPEKTDSQEPSLATNGVASSLVNPVFEDQGDQPPAVHAEEVVETAVSLESHEPGPEATGAGEAMADEEEEDMGTEDTNASTSSSSSSSSEDLSNSDANESPSAGSTPPSAVTSSSSELSEARPWASIAAEGENKQKAHSMDLEASESMPDTSKTCDSEYQAETLAVSPSLPSTLMSSSSTGTADCPSPMDTTASTSSHTGPPCKEASEQVVEPVSNESESASAGHNHDRPEHVAPEVESGINGESGRDISSSSSSSLPASAIEETPPPVDTISEQGLASDSTEEEEDASGDTMVELSPSAAVVTSSESSSLQLLEPVHSKDVSSSNHQLLRETSEEEPQAKHRRLSDDIEPCLSPLKSNSQDSEPSSSSGTSPEIEASSAEHLSPGLTDGASVSNISSTADTTAALAASNSPVANKNALDSTLDEALGKPTSKSPEPGLCEQISGTEVGVGDGDMSQPGVKESPIDPSAGLADSACPKTSDSSPNKAEGLETKDQMLLTEERSSVASQGNSSEVSSGEEPMDQD